jgi:starvation-inducible DNA-binding protein
VHPTRNDLPVSTRTKVCELLNARLADSIDLALQAKQAHWNVKGPNFIALHELFDKVRTAADGAVDSIAERIAQLGATAEGTTQAVAKRSTLAPYPLEISSGRDHVAALAGALAAAAKANRAAIDTAAELRDVATSDLFTEVTRELDLQLWFVEAHLQATA